MKCKAFDLILKELNARPDRLKQWLEDKRPTLTEKKIILGYSWIRNNDNKKVLDEICALQASDIDFVEAHRQLLIGIAANNLSHFELALVSLNTASLAFESLDLPADKFLAHFNLFILMLNRGDLASMKHHLNKMRVIPEAVSSQGHRLLRCEFSYAAELGDKARAHEWLQKIDSIKNQFSENDIISHLVSEFIFHVSCDDLVSARRVHEEMRKHRKFQLSENFNYMKKLLDHLELGSPIYAYAKDFAEVPLLFHQLQVIQTLEAVEYDEAQQHWEALKKIMPEAYGENFEYQGRKCLFSLALEKNRIQTKKPLTVFDSSDNKMDRLVKILEENPAGIRKTELYELLWGEHPETKDDLQRLARMVSRVRQARGIEIQTKKGSYALEALKKKKLAV